MSLTTRALTGLPSWPITLLAGVPKSGKTLTAVAASASDLVHRTFLVSQGEDVPDEYGQLPGQRVEVAEHAGTYRDLIRVLRDVVAVPGGPDGQPNLVVLDSATRTYDLIMDTCMDVAVARASRYGKPAPDKLPPDLWNTAHDRWEDVLDILRAHRGPVVLTARLDLVAVFENGAPTTRQRWKVQGHKSLEYDASAIIELREQARPGQPAPATLRGLRTLALDAGQVDADGAVAFPHGLALDKMWRGLGLAASAGVRAHAAVVRVPQGEQQQQPARPAAPVVGARPVEPRDTERVTPVTRVAPAVDAAALADVIRNAPSLATMGVQLVRLGAARTQGSGWHLLPEAARVHVVCDLGEGPAGELVEYMAGRLPAVDPAHADPEPLAPRPTSRVDPDDLPHGLQSVAVPADGEA